MTPFRAFLLTAGIILIGSAVLNEPAIPFDLAKAQTDEDYARMEPSAYEAITAGNDRN